MGIFQPSNSSIGSKSERLAAETYAPPPGPPPGYKIRSEQPQRSSQQQAQPRPPTRPPLGDREYEPLAGTSRQDHICEDPPPYHDWTVVPDTALLPPPPSFGHNRSPLSNASASDADRAYNWCKAYPLVVPHQPTYAQHEAMLKGDVRLMKPPEFNGHLLMPGKGAWKGSTRAGSKDACILTSLPLYFALADSPFITGTTKTIYYELRVLSLGHEHGADESSIALGYCAMPYPTWRMPGWERGSLAVHGDDGRRYVNDSRGGKDFTAAFQVGETVGLGMSFSIPNNPPVYGAPSQASTGIDTEVFLTRNGRKCGVWNLHEELDNTNDLDVNGLDGQFDLYGAVGVFGGVEFDVSMSPSFS